MPPLVRLPREILNGVFQGVDPEDLANLSKTCQVLNIFIKYDRLLWKDVYLRNYDYQSLKPEQPEPEWQLELQSLTRLKKLLHSTDSDVKRKHLSEVGTAIVKLLGTTSSNFETSLNLAFLAEAFKTQVNIDTFLSSSSLFKHAGPKSCFPASTIDGRQMSAKMHVFYGLSIEPKPDENESGRAMRIHPYARSRVYDLRRYNDYNQWGPFLDDGTFSVDWEKVQCVMIVLRHNLRAFTERAHGLPHGPRHLEKPEFPFLGTAPNSYKSGPSCPAHEAMQVKEPTPPLASQDPYNVTGTWRRVVCFLDYTDLYAFNFEGDRREIPLDQDREPIDTQEAIRLITLKIHVTAVSPPGEDDHPDWPVVSFNGTSRSMHTSWDPNANSRIRGTVRTTKEGEVRWTSFSIYHGEERWRSEGVQIGGPRSARGIVGTWFDKDYDIHGPAGPTAFWKLTDDIEVEKLQPVQSFIWNP